MYRLWLQLMSVKHKTCGLFSDCSMTQDLETDSVTDSNGSADSEMSCLSSLSLISRSVK